MARGNRHQPPFPVRRVGQTRANILLREFGTIIEDCLMRHADGQPAQNVTHGNAEAPDTGLASAHAGFNGDDALIAHAGTLPDELWRSNPALRLRRVPSPSPLLPVPSHIHQPSSAVKQETPPATTLYFGEPAKNPRHRLGTFSFAKDISHEQNPHDANPANTHELNSRLRPLRFCEKFRHSFLTADGRGWTQITEHPWASVSIRGRKLQ